MVVKSECGPNFQRTSRTHIYKANPPSINPGSAPGLRVLCPSTINLIFVICHFPSKIACDRLNKYGLNNLISMCWVKFFLKVASLILHFYSY